MVSASDASADAVEVARANAARARPRRASWSVARGLPAGEYDLVVANLPYVREDEWARLAAGDQPATSRARRSCRAPTGSTRSARWWRRRPAGTRLALEHAPGAGRGGARAAAATPRTLPDLAGRERVTVGARAAVNVGDLRALHRGGRRGAVPCRHRLRAGDRARTRASAVERLYAIKGRPPDRPAAVMFFQPRAARSPRCPSSGPRTRAALERLLPGPVTLVLPNPARRFPLACGPSPERLGLRVPGRAARSRDGALAGAAVERQPAAAAPTRAASRTSTRASARAWTSSSTAASCPARRRRWWTSRASRSAGEYEVAARGRAAGGGATRPVLGEPLQVQQLPARHHQVAHREHLAAPAGGAAAPMRGAAPGASGVRRGVRQVGERPRGRAAASAARS